MKKAMRILSSAVLDDVAQGIEVVITRDGKEVARLVPSDAPRLSREEFLRNAAEIRARQPLNCSRAEDLVREDRDR